MTQCTQSTFEFATHERREVVARFDGGTMSSDGGGLLLREFLLWMGNILLLRTRSWV